MSVFIKPAEAKKINANVLKNMNMHETKTLGRVHILRVWGGWIYYSCEAAKVITAVFVPQTSPRVDRIDESQ